MRTARLVAALAAVAGCTGTDADARGRAAREAARIVSLHDVTSEAIAALGAVDRLVGVAAPVDLDRAARVELAAVPQVQGIESVVAQRPSAVVGTDVLARRDPGLVGALRGRGVEVRLYRLRRLEDTYTMLLDLGALLEVEGAARFVRALRAAADSVAAPSRPPRRVFVYDCCNPPFTAGGDAPVTELLARAGGVNVFADLPRPWAHVSWEQVIARRPDFILIHAYDYAGQGDLSTKRAALRRIPGLAHQPVAVMPLRFALGGMGSHRGLFHLVDLFAGERR